MSSRYSNCSMSIDASLDFMESLNTGIDDLDQSFDNTIGKDVKLLELESYELSSQDPGRMVSNNRSKYKFRVCIASWSNFG